MHQYLKAIGFEDLRTKRELNEILAEVKTIFTHQTIVSYNTEADFCEFQKEYGPDIGIVLCGEMDGKDTFTQDYYFPYFTGDGVSTYADVMVERRIEKEEYIGICEDEKVGISIMFHLQNGVDYMREKEMGFIPKAGTSVTFSGLALSGTILFPVKKDKALQEASIKENMNRKKLLNAARSGDQTAIETLTLDDMDTYSQVSRRLASEDVLSIVDTYFMPYGVECDLYSIMGEIQNFYKVVNEYTGVELYQMKLDVNELLFDVCVPVNEVLGEPEIGRRFKATIWLQGYINF